MTASVPRPDGYEDNVRAAREAHRVKTRLPSFFNPLFRRQGAVNRFTLDALETVGATVSKLAGEIEARDRTIEHLVANLAAQFEQTHAYNEALGRFCRSMERNVDALTGAMRGSDLRMKVAVEGFRSEIAALFSSIAAQKETSAKLIERQRDDRQTLETSLGTLGQRAEEAAAAIVEIKNNAGEQSRAAEAAAEKIETLATAFPKHVEESRKSLDVQRADLERAIATTKATVEAELKAANASLETAMTARFITELKNSVIAVEKTMASRFHDELKKALADQESALTARFQKELSQATAAQEAGLTSRFVSELKGSAVALEGTMTARFKEELRHALAAQESHLAARFLSEVKSSAAALESAVASRFHQELQLAVDAQEASLTTRFQERLESSIASVQGALTALVERDSSARRMEIQAERQTSAVNFAEAAGKFNALADRLSSFESWKHADGSRPAADVDHVTAQIIEIRIILGSLQSLGRAADLDLLTLGEATDRLHHAVAELGERVDKVQKEDTKLLPSPAFDAFYRDFEAKFRGSRELIRNRVEKYVGTVEEALERTASARSIGPAPVAPVLDLGCGRGEWLEVLVSHGIQARGVDLNLVFVEGCRTGGLDVVTGDALAHLRSMEGGSVSAITSFHMVEHLPFPLVIELMAEAYRVLAHGGVLILETPNPNNLLVASIDFHLDPTHLHPLPPPLLEFTAHQAGFEKVRIEPANPYPEDVLLPAQSELHRRWNRLFYGEQDYAIVAEK